MSQADLAEYVFIDDRALIVEATRQLGICGIQYQSPEQLREELRASGIAIET